MINCNRYPLHMKCSTTTAEPRSDGQQLTTTTAQPNGDDTTVIALGVVAGIGILVLAVVLGIIIYRRMRTKKPKPNLESPVPIQNHSGSLENKYSGMDELHSREYNENPSKMEYISCQENDKIDSFYSRIDESSLRKSCDYAEAMFPDEQVDTEKNDHKAVDDTYNTLNDMVEKVENTDDYSHARVVKSPEEGTIEEGSLGQETDDYDMFSQRPNKTAVNRSENDYDHMVNGELISS